MRIIAFIERPTVIEQFLTHLGPQSPGCRGGLSVLPSITPRGAASAASVSVTASPLAVGARVGPRPRICLAGIPPGARTWLFDGVQRVRRERKRAGAGPPGVGSNGRSLSDGISLQLRASRLQAVSRANRLFRRGPVTLSVCRARCLPRVREAESSEKTSCQLAWVGKRRAQFS